MYASVNSINDVKNIFPATPDAIASRTQEGIKKVQAALDAIIAIPASKRTFENTAQAFDQAAALSYLSSQFNAIQILEMVSPDEKVRAAAHDASIKISEFFIDSFGNNKKLYNAFKEYVEGNAKNEHLTEKDWYYLNEAMEDFKHAGLHLPDDQREKINAVQKELSLLTLQFDTNIAADQQKIAVSADELRGLSSEFINQLTKNEDGLYMLGSDSPTYSKVMENAQDQATRKKMFELYNNRAYPVNDDLLKQIIAQRDQLAKLLGYESYAAYDLEDEMVKTPERARTFLDDLVVQVEKKVDQEVQVLTKDLPAGIQLHDNKLLPYDTAYIKNQYKKSKLQVDEQEIANYFPMEKTVEGLLSIYERFFSLRFEQKPISGLWHNEVTLLEVYDQPTDTLLGYFLLDLYPRPFKYTHACHATIIPATFDGKGNANKALSIVIANFPRAVGDKPALLERKYVETFFHEFGHALHALLGRTKMAGMSGTHVKTDFVELPSQMLEEWLEDKEILKMVSSHYITGASLPDELIERVLALKKFDAGLMVQTQAYYARISLDVFAAGAQKDPFVITQGLYKDIRSHFIFDPKDHMYASFGHLTGYGAKYYGYLWSKVFALDLFAQIKKEGLLNPVAGKRYVDQVIGQGGSVDPNILIENFLGRKPNQEAFLHDLGL